MTQKHLRQERKHGKLIMTMPDERYRAVIWASNFLGDIANNPKKYPRIPKTIRQEAWSILRHYPSDWEMSRVAEKVPEVFQERMEPLYKMVKQYKQDKENETGT